MNKGPNRPAFTTALRLEALAALEAVDFVAANKWPVAIETIKMLQPAIYCKGPDYKNHADDVTGKIDEEQQAVEETLRACIEGQVGRTASKDYGNHPGVWWEDAHERGELEGCPERLLRIVPQL